MINFIQAGEFTGSVTVSLAPATQAFTYNEYSGAQTVNVAANALLLTVRNIGLAPVTVNSMTLTPGQTIQLDTVSDFASGAQYNCPALAIVLPSNGNVSVLEIRP